MQFGDKMHKLAGVLDGAPEASAFYKQITSLWVEPTRVVRDGAEPDGLLDDPRVKAMVPDFVERMQYLDTLTYLPDDILTKVDRASMAVSLEARVPLLDHRVVAFSWSLPPALKMQGGIGKRDPPPRARPLCPARARRPAEARLRRADRFLAQERAARLGGKPARRAQDRGRRHLRSRRPFASAGASICPARATGSTRSGRS